MINLNPEFLSKNGKKEFAVIPYEEFLELQGILEDLEDLKDLRESKEEFKNEPNVSFEEVKEMFGL